MKIQRYYALLPAVLLMAGCDKDDKKSSSVSSVVTAPVDYIATVGKAEQKAIKVIDLTAVNQNIQLFNAQEGRYPKDLNELVTMNYMPLIPAPPYGMKITYDAAAGKASMVKTNTPTQ